MSRFSNLDDLGEQNGQVEIPFAEQARQLVLSHRVAAIGHRPRDHAQRDLLIGGWQKDGRCYRFRKLIKNKDLRFYEDTSSLGESDRDTCARARAFQVLHAATLYRIKSDLDEDIPSSRTLSSILRCPPTLIGFDSEALKREGLRTCNRIRLCPYCLSRTVLNLYERLRNDYGVGTNKCLASLAVTSPMGAEVVSSGFRGGTRLLFKGATKEVRDQLANIAKNRLGFTGGLFVNDAGPVLLISDRWCDGELAVEKSKGLELHSAVLGEVSLTRAIGVMQDRSAKELQVPSIRIGPTEIRPTLTIRLCTERDALRSLLFGEAQSEYRGDDVVNGVFRFSPWYLASSDQWTSHLSVTKSLPLYQFWGEWKGRYGGRRRDRSELDAYTNADQRRGRFKSRRNLHEGNDRRRQEKEQALDEVVTSVRPLWDELCHKLNRRPGRSHLQQKARESGVAMSDRQTRAVIKRLAQE